MEKKSDGEKLNKKTLKKIAVVAVVVLLIGGVWLIKNWDSVFVRGSALEEEQLAGMEGDVAGYFPLLRHAPSPAFRL